jgi:hypothetical protein
MPERVGVGIRVKTARGIAVALTGPLASPQIVLRRQLGLSDPGVPTSGQPYHAGLGLDEDEAARVVGEASRAVRAVAKTAVLELVEELRTGGRKVSHVVLVRSSDTDPASIHNPHMHAHAAEGLLFFEALAEGAHSLGLEAAFVLEKRALEGAVEEAGRLRAEVVERIAALGKEVGPPWRADEKAACAAAWIALHRCR